MVSDHDTNQIKKMLQELFQFRGYFKALTDIGYDNIEEIYQSEISVNDKQTLLLSYREKLPEAIIVLITIITDDTGNLPPNWMYSLELTDAFILQMDLFEYKNLRELSEKIVQFSHSELFEELIKTVPLPKDDQRYFKLPEEEAPPTSRLAHSNYGQSTNGPVRKLYTTRTAMMESSSDYEETYYNETSSHFSKFK